ncbi:MAG TPA: D-alanyl-D-alanine carboxypeptidase/D-alanyl-D-alanine-endopeptidase [Gemmatimonadaceae bacterium]|nr:D-alanyl-D-alanine carboxypeptidase/D-alanyl-D-alanine-endopeptidase [Gemmatimonadaceae bacterium]
MRALPCSAGLAVAVLALTAATARGQSGAPGGGGGSRPAARSTPTAARAASGPLRHTTPTGTDSLASDLAELMNARVRNGTWGAMVVSLTRGDTLFAENAGGSLVPASTLKLFTTALAFERLGANHRFSTNVFRTGEVDPAGTLHGDLVLRGGGDPSLSRRFFEGDANAPMRSLARQVASAGIRRVRGNIVGDDGAFEAKPVPDGWLTRYLHASYAAPVSALSLNENLLYVVVTPGRAGAAGTVRLEPAADGAYRIANATSTRAGTRSSRLTVALAAQGVINVRGWIGATSEPRVYVVVVNDPSSFATNAFARALAEAGVAVEGEVRLSGTPEGALPVASLPSPPLWELANVMNRESVNHFAELIFRNVGRLGDPSGVGSAEMANALLRDFLLLRVGADPGDVFAADGSGLSTLDRVTPRAMVQLLSFAHGAPWSREFHESLPIAGRQETLRLRMRGTPAHGNLHAKTGTTNEVVGLSGYVASRDGEVLAFAFLYNGRDRFNARASIDAMGATLAAFAR